MPKGFEVEQAAFDAGPGTGLGSTSQAASQYKLKVGPGGRVVIPAAVREALGVEEGQVLVAVLDNGELRLSSMRTALGRARAIMREFVPAGVSLADELIADRRREQEREDRE